MRNVEYFVRLVCPSSLYAYSTKVRLPKATVDYRKFLIARWLLKNGGSVVDGGSHIGYYTRLFSETLEDRGTVWSFEPNPYIFRLLKKYAYQKKNITVTQKALSNREERVDFYLHPFSLQEDSTTESLYKSAAHRRISVETVTLDSLPIKDLKLIKLDVEGHELAALEGASQLIREFQPWIIFEYVCDQNRDDFPVLKCLENLDYVFFDLATLEKIVPHQLVSLTDGLAIPKNREQEAALFINSLALHQ